LGIIGARRLAARDRLRQRALRENDLNQPSSISREIVELVGREADLQRVLRLAHRNRSTIAITGRRGSGKSRLLREIYRREVETGRIGIWIDCPHNYAKEDFLSALLEALALRVETITAGLMGLKSLAIRRLELQSLRETGIILHCCVLGSKRQTVTLP
jgi:hypothetical protein